MKLAILSDAHDNIWKLAAALEKAWSTDALLFCGDFCAPFTLDQIGQGFPGPIHAVFGNNDGDRFLLAQVAARHPRVTLHGELARLELGGLRVGINHYPEIARDLARSGSYDLVCYGHDHRLHVGKEGATDLVNPGEIMGRLGKSTFVVYDTAGRGVEVVGV
ncbi:MAG TPA: YfcE family phosphodiesterase [Thermoanaerobaculia bacterium]|nr:YfcE family phosphodiesterase [Thermoanaerobaculia bacterium]